MVHHIESEIGPLGNPQRESGIPLGGISEEQIVRIIQEYAAGAKVSELCRKHGMSDATFYKWKARYGGLQISDVRRLKDLESENGKLKKLLAETMLDNAGLKGLLAKNF